MITCLILNIIRAIVLSIYLIAIGITRILLLIDKDMFRPQILVIFREILILYSLNPIY